MCGLLCKISHMATNLALDADLLERALEVSGERTKKAAVTLALEEFIARREQRAILDLFGKVRPGSRPTTTSRSARDVTTLVDTSVWSLALRRNAVPDAPEVVALGEALSGADLVVTTGFIMQELLQGDVP